MSISCVQFQYRYDMKIYCILYIGNTEYIIKCCLLIKKTSKTSRISLRSNLGSELLLTETYRTYKQHVFKTIHFLLFSYNLCNLRSLANFPAPIYLIMEKTVIVFTCTFRWIDLGLRHQTYRDSNKHIIDN